MSSNPDAASAADKKPEPEVQQPDENSNVISNEEPENDAEVTQAPEENGHLEVNDIEETQMNGEITAEA